MMKGLRTAGQTWLGKAIVAVLFGFLIVSFAIWGINDIFRGAQRTVVATVGDVEIPGESFRNAYQSELQQLIRRTRQSITPQQARAFGLDQQVLNRMITEATLDQRTRELGLVVSDQLAARTITEEPSFKGPNGQFDRARFEFYIGERGLTEAGFLREHRAALARLQLAQAVSGALVLPLAVREAVHRYGAERRSAAYLVLPAASLGEVPPPSEGQLQSFFNERRATFRSPEYRTVNVVAAAPESIAKPEAVSDDDARRRYEQTKNRFGTPERRSIQQIVFSSPGEAEAAYARVKEGATFEAVAAEHNIDAKDLDLGTFAKSDMVDPVVAEAAFALAPGVVSEPVKGRFGTVLVRVTNVEAASLRPFEQVADELKREIALERAKTAITDLHDKIEDQRAGARPLAEIARENGLPVITAPAIDRTGRTKTGTQLANLPDRDAVLAAAFSSDIGVDNEPLRTRDGGYVWFEVTAIEPARDKSFDEARSQVAEQWRADEVSRRLAERARELADRLDKAESLDAVAAEAGAQFRTAADLARRVAKDDLSAEVVNRIFSVPVNKSGSAETGDSRVVFKVTGATVP